jgi:hypothetical protein
VRKRLVIVRRPVVRTAASLRTQNRCSVGGENAGRNVLSSGMAHAATFIAVDLLWRELLPGYQIHWQHFTIKGPISQLLSHSQMGKGQKSSSARLLPFCEALG